MKLNLKQYQWARAERIKIGVGETSTRTPVERVANVPGGTENHVFVAVELRALPGAKAETVRATADNIEDAVTDALRIRRLSGLPIEIAPAALEMLKQ